MKKFIPVFAILLFVSCGLKHTQKLLYSGNYDQVINSALENLKSGKDKRSKQEYIYLLEDAFAKAKEKDLNAINLWGLDKNPVVLEKIYSTYLKLNERQEKIKPLLPLQLTKYGRNANFSFENYNSKIADSRNELSIYLYNNGKQLLLTSDKLNFRKAYDDLLYLNKINPNFNNVTELISEAKDKGSDHVIVETTNETNTIIPITLQNEILDFSTNDLNSKWTVYHNSRQARIAYDYDMLINFRQIYISPEQINEKEFEKERVIKDGTKKLIDANGKEVVDDKGKVVMVDNFKTVNARIYESKQYKFCKITAEVEYIDNKINKTVQAFPVSSESVFEHYFATFKGDRRAADDSYYSYFDNHRLKFPTSEQMIFDTATGLKQKLKEVVIRNPISQQ